MTDRLPLPEPDGWAGRDYYHRPATTLSDIIFAPEQARYTADQMRDYADACNAALRERVKVLEDALRGALDHMDRARDILTDGKPRPECNWGMLATESAREALRETE